MSSRRMVAAALLIVPILGYTTLAMLRTNDMGSLRDLWVLGVVAATFAGLLIGLAPQR